MMTAEVNRLLTRVGPGTPMGNYLRRYWMPVAGESEFERGATKPVRLFGEDLVLYRDLRGNFGLIARHCAHRRADLSYAIPEEDGLRCNYHGWMYNARGQCTEQPYEDQVSPGREISNRPKLVGYLVRPHAGLLWAYMGPEPAPLIPDWEPFGRQNVFVQVVLAQVPCNWLQCQENSIDPVHFEWMHENWDARLRQGRSAEYGPTHTRLRFEEFEYGLMYQRLRADTTESHPLWTVGRVCLWPNAFFLGEHFEWRVPIDDENTLSVVWKATRVPKDREPYQQRSIPTWTGPVTDERGDMITTHVMNQDFLAWVGQGRITDRTAEILGASDQGIVMLRRRLLKELEHVAAGGEPKGLVRDPEHNRGIALPLAYPESATQGYTRAQLLADPYKRTRFLSYMFQAGQPETVRAELSRAMGLDVEDFRGVVRPPPA